MSDQPPPTPLPPPPVTGLPPVRQPLDDPNRLIDASRAQPGPRFLRPKLALYLMIAGVVLLLLPIQLPTLIIAEVVLWGAFIGVVIYFWTLVRTLKREAAVLDQVEDALALKRYPEVAYHLEWLMSQPMRSDQHRLRGLVLLATTLARLGRYDEALNVYNELVEAERVAGPSGAMVKLGRAMVMLQSDHLYDADRAIIDLRRLIDRGGAEDELQRIDASIPTQPADALSIGALRLIELYRDVKTGHAEEAIQLFEQNLPLMTAGLGHRVGEAHALAAVAYDRLGQTDTARSRFLDGTALQGVGDMLNRYPELRPLIAKYHPTPAPTF